MMKLTKIILIIAALNLVSCSLHDPSFEHAEQIISPNGIVLANSVLDLEHIIKEHVYAKIGSQSLFEIKNFQFYKDLESTSCLINYVLQDGGQYNVLFVIKLGKKNKVERHMIISCEGSSKLLLDIESGEAHCENDAALIVNISEEY